MHTSFSNRNITAPIGLGFHFTISPYKLTSHVQTRRAFFIIPYSRLIINWNKWREVGGGASESVGSVPAKVALNQNYPNPFNPATVIRYELPTAGAVKLSIFDVLGREVATLVNECRDAGIYEVMFNASSLSSGTYFYRLESRSSCSRAGLLVETKKMILVK